MDKQNIKYFTNKLENLAINKEFFLKLANTNSYLSEEKIQKLNCYYHNATKFVMNYIGKDVLPYVQMILQDDIEKNKHKKFVFEVYKNLSNQISDFLSKQKEQSKLEK